MSEVRLELKDIPNCPDGKIISVVGVLDATNIATASEQIREIIRAGFVKLIFDYTQLTYINSTALGDLVAYRRECSKKGGSISVAGASENIMEICEAIGLTMIFGFYNTVEEAIAKIK